MFEKMKSIISEQLGVDENNIELETSFKEDLDAAIAMTEEILFHTKYDSHSLAFWPPPKSQRLSGNEEY